MLMHENAPHCRARVMQEFLQCAGFTVMPWLLVSLHLNPIGNVWIAMKSAQRERPVAGSSDDLFTLLTEIWGSMDALPAISSMRSRLVATIDSEGGHTKY